MGRLVTYRRHILSDPAEASQRFKRKWGMVQDLRFDVEAKYIPERLQVRQDML